jgi:hypothetical protein
VNAAGASDVDSNIVAASAQQMVLDPHVLAAIICTLFAVVAALILVLILLAEAEEERKKKGRGRK